MEIAGSKNWLEIFKARCGRPPKILHIGNIANNAYLNAKYLNHAGYDCDVLCNDYYHIMASPEWEELEISGKLNNPNSPEWFSLVDSNYTRPKWFAQGSLKTAVDYLISKREGRFSDAENLWNQLGIENKTIRVIAAPKKTPYDLKLDLEFFQKKINNFYKKVNKYVSKIFITFTQKPSIKKSENLEFNLQEHYKWFNYWKLIYSKIRQNENDELKISDIIGYYDSLPILKRLFDNYDIIHCYAETGIWCLLSNKPYVAYEHGTIRVTPFQDSSQGRLCRLTYCFANGVIITNADNVVAAKKLDLQNYKFVPHPINEDLFNINSLDQNELLRDSFKKKINADFIIFHPSRQHWGGNDRGNWDKGNDIFLHGLAKFIHERKIQVKAILVEWGQSTDESKRLIKKLDIVKNIIWIAPVSAKGMAKYIQLADLMADQFYLGAFGSTLPRALACGTPSMIYLDEQLHKWCFDDLPPVINVSNDGEVCEGLKKVYENKDWVDSNSKSSKEWFLKNHSSKVIVEKLSDSYQGALMLKNGI